MPYLPPVAIRITAFERVVATHSMPSFLDQASPDVLVAERPGVLRLLLRRVGHEKTIAVIVPSSPPHGLVVVHYHGPVPTNRSCSAELDGTADRHPVGLVLMPTAVPHGPAGQSTTTPHSHGIYVVPHLVFAHFWPPPFASPLIDSPLDVGHQFFIETVDHDGPRCLTFFTPPVAHAVHVPCE